MKERTIIDGLKSYVIQLTGKGGSGLYSYDIDQVNLFPLGQNYIAVSDDADKLYTRLGWDFTDFLYEGRVYSYMPVSAEGFEVLRHKDSPLKVKVLDIECPCPQYKAVPRIPLIQQTIDYLRLLSTESVSYPLVGVTATIDDGNIQDIVRLSELRISGNEFSVQIEGGSLVALAFGHQWNFRPVGTALIDAIGRTLSHYMEDIKAFISGEAVAMMLVAPRCSSVYNAYKEAKNRCDKEEIPLVNQKGYLITFDDDAALLSAAIHVPYYHCNTDSMGHLSAYIPNSMLEKASESDVNIRVVTPDDRYELQQLCLTDSILNIKPSDGLVISNVIVNKDIKGSFYIQASANGEVLPQKPIPNKFGFYYSSLRDSGLEKELMLKALAYKSYQ